MASLQERKIVEATAESVNEDFMAYLTYIQENEIKLAKKSAHISRKDCFAINQKLKCQPEDWEKPTRVQETYIEIDFFYYCCLRFGLYRLVKQGNGYRFEENDCLKEFLELDSVTRYCLFLAILLGEYADIVERGVFLMSAGGIMDALKTTAAGDLVKDVFGRDYWLADYKYNPSVKLIALLGLTNIIWLQDSDMLKSAKACNLSANGLGIYVAKKIDHKKRLHQESEPVEYLWKRFCTLWGGNEEGKRFLDDKAEDQTESIFYMTVSVADCIRKIKIRGNWTLNDLHNCIQKAVDFDNDHLYCFTVGHDKFKKEYFHPYCQEQRYLADEVMIGELPLEKCSAFSYLFDFGDSWYFDIKVDKIVEEEFDGVEIIEAIGKAPEQYNMCEW